MYVLARNVYGSHVRDPAAPALPRPVAGQGKVPGLRAIMRAILLSWEIMRAHSFSLSLFPIFFLTAVNPPKRLPYSLC
jgi:hypothetical protein